MESEEEEEEAWLDAQMDPSFFFVKSDAQFFLPSSFYELLCSLQSEGQSWVQRVASYLWLSALMSPEAGGWTQHCSNPSRAQRSQLRPPPPLAPALHPLHPLHPLCSQESPAAALTSLFTPTLASLACLLILRAGFSCSLAHSDTQSAMSAPVSTRPHIHPGHIKLPPVYSGVEVIDWVEF